MRRPDPAEGHHEENATVVLAASLAPEAPDVVAAGTGGLAADRGLPTLVIGLMVVGALALIAPAALSARRRT